MATLFSMQLAFASAPQTLSPEEALLNKAAAAVGLPMESLATVEFKEQELVVMYFSDADEQVKRLSFDLGLNRVADYIIREVKGKNPQNTKTANPISVNNMQVIIQFVWMQLVNMIPKDLRSDLYHQRSELMILDNDFLGYLNPFVSRPYSNRWDNETPVKTLLDFANLNDDQLRQRGCQRPERDLIKILLAYGFVANTTVFFTHIGASSISL